jgi:acetoin utilization deacetylase AcuC-like enzyme
MKMSWSLPQIKKAKLAERELLMLAHHQAYVDDILELKLERTRARKIGLPLTKEMVNRARASMQAFTNAVDSALINGFSASLAGGTHHAHYDEGEGFCFFNDFAINVRRLYHQYPTRKILILDLDVHQGNGNSSILKDDPNVFIVSLHGKRNYPYRKIESHIDIEFEKSNI